MSVPPQVPAPIITEHGLLVPFGRFAAQIGLIDRLNQVLFAMKTVDHSPGEKLTELLVHILAGGMHVTELETSPHPLVHDTAVAQAWGQDSFASASGVSDLLRAASPDTVRTLKEAIQQVLAPYRRRILRDLTAAFLTVDFDLTGLVVSDQAKTYEGADFGYMGEVGGVGRGYQFARAQLVGPHGPLILGGFLHPGHTVSLHCVAELVTLVEAEVGPPHRRVAAVEQRLAAAEGQLAKLEAALANRAQGSPTTSSRQHERLQVRTERTRTEVARLRERRDGLATENATNSNPRRILLRLDGGFGDAEHLTWLYEQGYDFVVRPYSHRIGERLRQEEGLTWEKVSKNGFVAESRRTTLGTCPYPLRVFACRQWWGEDRPERWSALVVNPELDRAAWPVRRVGVFYNQRQVAEASIKESKGIFASRHLPTRHEAGLAVYQELVLLVQNLMRWFRRQCLGHTPLATAGIKELVRVGANSRALLIRSGRALGIRFAADGPWQGLTVLSAHVSYQLWFPFLEESRFARAAP